jgi:DNA-binding NarL/FixJ family response regulator
MLGVPIYRNDGVVGVLYGGLRRPEYIGDRGRLGLHNVAKLFAATLSTQEVTDRLKREGRAETGGALASSSESTVREYPNPTAGRSTDAVLLTVREREVLELLAQGLATRDIAREEYLAINTVRSYVQSALWKLGAHSRLEAVAVARELGLI